MKRDRSRVGVLCPVLAWAAATSPAAEEDFDLAFSTHIGGSNWEHARDVYADGDGNVYVVGGTASADFPTTPLGVYDRTFLSKQAENPY